MAASIEGSPALAEGLQGLRSAACLIGVDGRCVAANPAAARLVGAVPGGAWVELLPRDRRPEGARAWADALRGSAAALDVLVHGKPYRVQLVGAERGVLVLWLPPPPADAAREAALRAKVRLETMFSANLIGNITWRLDGTVTGANDAFLRMVGYSREELEAGRISWRSMTPIEHADADAAKVADLRERRIHAPYEKEYFRKDRSRVPVLVSSAVFPDADDEGISYIVDLTEVKRAESRVRELLARAEESRRTQAETAAVLARERERLAIALRAAEMGVYEWRLGETTVWWSPELYPVYGLDPRTFAPTVEGFGAMIHPDDREALWRKTEECIAQRTVFSHEYRIVRPDGTVRWVANRSQVGLDPGGEVERITGVAYDVTERRRAEEALREADRRKDEFLAVLAHELRNPLAPLRTGLELLRLAPDGASVERARAMMARQVAHMVRLIDDLLDVSRIARGKLEVRRRPLDLAVAVRSALETSAPLVESARHALEVALPGAPVIVAGDEVRLAQVFANLLNNAARYTLPGGRIAVALHVADGAAIATVEDDGAGIPADMLERIFEPFVQVDRRDGSQHGLGLGLALAHTVVRLHGGTIRAESAGRGRGSRFTVRLPLAAAEAMPTAGSSAVPAAGARRRVLVVDDNRDAAESLGALLQLLGHDVRVTADGRAALQAAAAQRPEVVILDIGMPDMDGYEIARRLRADGCAAAMLIALTGYGQDADRLKSAQAGFDAHLVKPVELAALEALFAGAHEG